MQYDLPLEELRRYAPDLSGIVAPDFDTFWTAALSRAEQMAAPPVLEPVETGMPMIEAYDLTFSGFDGQPVRGWFIRPAGLVGPLPCIIQYLGYGGGRGRPEEYLHWPATGYACLVMDLRGQGAGWTGGRGSTGATDDPSGSGGPQTAGFLTRGIRAPETSYYHRLFVDAIMCARVASRIDGVDPDNIVASGASQGGAQALAAAAFAPVAAALVDVPFLCHIAQAITMVDSDPYFELVRYLRWQRGAEADVMRTLSYIDAVGFAARAKAPAMFSVALMDRIIPPRTVFAAYNAYAGAKEIEVYPYADHEGGEADQLQKQRRFLSALL
ncbi:acetylxylan esterase [Oceanomicrobium pacificus]|nr:acetylxylan esterase [Oceanomicrobium pacificus]